MAFLRTLLLFVGVLAVLMGLLWVGQGLGIIMWPKTSPMLAEQKWAVNGSVLAACGLVAIWFARRRRG